LSTSFWHPLRFHRPNALRPFRLSPGACAHDTHDSVSQLNSQRTPHRAWHIDTYILSQESHSHIRTDREPPPGTNTRVAYSPVAAANRGENRVVRHAKARKNPGSLRSPGMIACASPPYSASRSLPTHTQVASPTCNLLSSLPEDDCIDAYWRIAGAGSGCVVGRAAHN
jgi:hypothetical protein